MTKMKSFRLDDWALQMIQELQDTGFVHKTATDVIQHAVLKDYESLYGKIGIEELNELGDKYHKTHQATT